MNEDLNSKNPMNKIVKLIIRSALMLAISGVANVDAADVMHSGSNLSATEVGAIVRRAIGALDSIDCAIKYDGVIVQTKEPLYEIVQFSYDFRSGFYAVTERYYKDKERKSLVREINRNWNGRSSTFCDRIVTGAKGKRLLPGGILEDPGVGVIKRAPEPMPFDYLYAFLNPFGNRPLFEVLSDGSFAVKDQISVRGRTGIVLENGGQRIIIDAERGIPLQISAGIDPSNPTNRLLVNDAVLVDGFWLPSDITRTSETKEFGEITTRCRLIPGSIHVNHEGEGAFDFRFPQGCLVSNEILNKTDAVTDTEGNKTPAPLIIEKPD